MIVLNMVFIPMYGIEGSAFATLVTVMIYNTIKLLFVVNKMDLFPFTNKTLGSLGILAGCFLLFYFWDFPFHAIINIGLKSILVSCLYLFLNYRLAISADINTVIDNFLARLKAK
jgi:O-antigen/teichoic acid export membrane protein